MGTERSGRKGWLRLGMTLVLLGLSALVLAARPSGEAGKDWGDPKGDKCVACHAQQTPGMYWEWNHSNHGQAGVNCYDCHRTEDGDKDRFEHNGELISVIVTPKDCSRCHSTE
ncbi:MAG: cytochrome C552, partial [Pseudomonadota bacterium]